MDIATNTGPQKLLSRRISFGIALGAVALGLLAFYHSNQYPRTDDAEVFANFIGIAPQVFEKVVGKMLTADLSVVVDHRRGGAQQIA